MEPPVNGALALAAATAVLVDLLENRLIQREVANSIGAVAVTTLPPDRISVGADEQSGLNLFLFRVSADTRWRRNGSPRDLPPLSLHLHYLLTAYSQREYEAEILLGYAMQALQETPQLDSTNIAAALTSDASGRHLDSPIRAALATYDRAGLQQLTISPEFLSLEDMSRLWSSLQARYRPSMTYTVSSVAIEVQP
jgi:hypothetical protein